MAALVKACSWFALLAAGSACRASGSTPFPTHDQDEESGIAIVGNAEAPREAPIASPNALLAVEPPHGPFAGGTVARLRGNGFTSEVRVWFGANEVPSEDVIVAGANRIQLTVPPGIAGPVDVVAQNGEDASTRVSLSGAYTYDSFYADPSSGPTSGGTLLTLHGQSTAWEQNTLVTLDREPCELVELRSPEELICRTPPGIAGARSARVTTSDGTGVDVQDAFTYSNSDNGFRGGLSGGAFDGELMVLALDAGTGRALGGTTVIVGTESPAVDRTDTNGVAIFHTSPDQPPTVTVARDCYQPATFVEIPTKQLTVYLDPVLSPICASPEGDLRGGRPTQAGGVRGELLWKQRRESGRDGWTNVPWPKSDQEQHVAYVFPLASRPSQQFSVSNAVARITPQDQGNYGFEFNIRDRPGNYTLYAVAGIEDRSRTPARFTAYSMGLIRGVVLPAGSFTENVFIRVDVPLDHELRLNVQGPTPTRRGPDRLRAQVSIQLGSEGFITVPGGQVDARLGGAPQQLSLVGVPPLSGSLLGATYVIAARAVTGDAGGTPRSVHSLLGTTSTAIPPLIGPFLEVPGLVQPPFNTRWNGRDLQWSSVQGGPEPDLVMIDVGAAGDLYTWKIVAPGSHSILRLPDLGAIDPALAWPSGAQRISVTVARIASFDYGSLRTVDLTERGWTSYAIDTFFATR